MAILLTSVIISCTKGLDKSTDCFFFVECFQSNLLLLFVVVSCLVLTKLLSVFKLFIDMFCIIHHFFSHQSDIHGPRYKWYPYFENVHPVNMKHLKVAWKIKKKSLFGWLNWLKGYFYLFIERSKHVNWWCTPILLGLWIWSWKLRFKNFWSWLGKYIGSQFMSR